MGLATTILRMGTGEDSGGPVVVVVHEYSNRIPVASAEDEWTNVPPNPLGSVNEAVMDTVQPPRSELILVRY